MYCKGFFKADSQKLCHPPYAENLDYTISSSSNMPVETPFLDARQAHPEHEEGMSRTRESLYPSCHAANVMDETL